MSEWQVSIATAPKRMPAPAKGKPAVCDGMKVRGMRGQ